MTVEQIFINAKVDSKKIERFEYNGRPHIKVPSYTLPANCIMNDGLYTLDQIQANYKSLEGTFAPLGHPMKDGKYISAREPEAINSFHIGAWNRNVTLEGNRVYLEKWIDIEVAQRTEDGRRVLERIEALERGEGEPISTSVAVFAERVPADGSQGYTWIANIKSCDHDALLLDEAPAASPDQGVGMMVNSEDAVAFNVNEMAFQNKTARQKEDEINRAAREQFKYSESNWVYVVDYTDTQAIIQIGNDKPKVFGYTYENDKIVFDNTGKPVESKTIWQVVANAWRALNPFSQPQAAPAQQLEANEMAMTAEEQKALTEQISQALTANMAEALKPLQTELAELKANQTAVAEKLEANQKAAEAEKRAAVAAKFGEVVANSLSGAALDEMHSKLGDAAALAANSAQAAAAGEKFDQFPE